MRRSSDHTSQLKDVNVIEEPAHARARPDTLPAIPPMSYFEPLPTSRSHNASPTLYRSAAIPFNTLARSAPATPIISQSPRKSSLLSTSIGACDSPPCSSPTTTNQNRYKTELCRSFLENGTCRYGSKCQFAHGEHELRPIHRHPRYKTEICQTFQLYGTCKYGSRCRFIHPHPTESSLSETASSPSSPFGFAVDDDNDRLPVFQQLSQH